MHSRIYRTIAVVAVCAAAGWVGTPGAAQAKPACSEVCTVTLKAGPQKKMWRSPQRFGAVTVNLGVTDGFSGLALPRTIKDGGCTAIYRTTGLFVKIEVCGRGAVPIRVTSRAGRPGRIFIVAYEGVR